MAYVNDESSTENGLKYEYKNEPKPSAEEGMHPHRGMATMRLTPDGEKIDGEYYSDQHRRNAGTFDVHLIARNRLAFDEACRSTIKGK